MTEHILSKLKTRMETSPESPAFRALGYEDLDYLPLIDLINEVIDDLKALGITSQDPVAYIADNDHATAILSLALMSHTVAVPVNPNFKKSEFEYLLTHVPVKTVLVPTKLRKIFEGSIENLQLPIVEMENSKWRIAFIPQNNLEANNKFQKVKKFPDNTAVILQTSGSTALPKIVPLTHRNLITSANNVINSLSLTAEDSCLHMLPFYHIGGLVDVLLAPLFSGGQVVLNRGFDSDSFFKHNRQYAPTWTQTVPVMLGDLIEILRRDDIDLSDSSLRFIRSVSSPLPERLYQSAKREFATSVVEIYGMTECAGVITSNPVETKSQKTGSVGTSAGPGIRIVNVDGRIAEVLHPGEIQVQGPSVMNGYVNSDLENTDSVDFVDEWFKTGDIGYLDRDGYLFITGRLKEMINRGGEKISPVEIETVVLQHPLIFDAACFAAPHPELGEDIALAVVVKQEKKILQAELQQFLMERLAYFKVPRKIYYIDSIPRQNGKLRRNLLSELLPVQDNLSPGKQTLNDGIQTALGGELAELWSGVLQVNEISPDADFFYLGGDSLSATVLVNKIREKWDVPVLVSAIYDAPVFREFEQHLRKVYPELMDKFAV